MKARGCEPPVNLPLVENVGVTGTGECMGRRNSMDREVAQSRARRIAGSVLIVLLGLVLASSAIVKFAHVPGVVTTMAASGFANGKLTLVATLELLSAALFLL